MRTSVISSLVIGEMWLCACASTPLYEATTDQSGRATLVQQEPATEADCSPGRACTCGNGTIEPNEECDPVASGWADFCDDTCKRTIYEQCELSEQCFGQGSLCAAYEPGEGGSFCADFCKHDADCVQLPGFRSACNFAWCAVLCVDGECPDGMICVPGQSLRDNKAKLVELDIGICTTRVL